MPSACEPTPTHLPQTADRALQVLASFDREHPERGVTEVAHEFGISISSAQRLLAVLAYRGFLSRDSENRRYRIGPAALHMGRLWDRTGAVIRVVTPFLTDLAMFSGCGAYFSVPDGPYMRCLALCDGPEGMLRDYSLVGEMYPAHAGATSKAYFAFLPSEERDRILRDRPMARFTPSTVTDWAVLDQQFAKIRERGWAHTVGEYSAGTATVSVPVFLHGALYASLSVGWIDGDDEHLSAERLSELIAELRECAARIDRKLSLPVRTRA
ncbi:IclR family transcriptional regulator [Paramicrobacterium sp. CJ85]|uniref:IclR family transcriptional regulator n=1 Tax=Paramicrobacterium sp. CJ85 TaxID=3445355 RepID=UPI003F60E720